MKPGPHRKVCCVCTCMHVCSSVCVCVYVCMWVVLMTEHLAWGGVGGARRSSPREFLGLVWGGWRGQEFARVQVELVDGGVGDGLQAGRLAHPATAATPSAPPHQALSLRPP